MDLDSNLVITEKYPPPLLCGPQRREGCVQNVGELASSQFCDEWRERKREKREKSERGERGGVREEEERLEREEREE